VRLLMAGIRNAEVDARTDGRGGVLSESDVLALVRREVKQHEESLAEARKAGREDLTAEQPPSWNSSKCTCRATDPRADR